MLLSAYQIRNVLRVYRDQLKEIEVSRHRIDPTIERIIPPVDNINKTSESHQLKKIITQTKSKYLT